MKERCDCFFRNYKLTLLTIFELIHCLIFLTFSFIKLVKSKEFEYEMYIFTTNSVLIIFMFYFSFHSVKKKNFVEVLSFLIMSLLSSFIMIYDFIDIIISKEVKAFKIRKDLYHILIQ